MKVLLGEETRRNLDRVICRIVGLFSGFCSIQFVVVGCIVVVVVVAVVVNSISIGVRWMRVEF